MCRPPCWPERDEENIVFFLGEWVRLEMMERSGAAGRLEGGKENDKRRKVAAAEGGVFG